MLDVASGDAADPTPPSWDAITLPDTWADRLNFKRPGDWLKLLRAMLSKGRKLDIPEAMPGRDALPKYLLQEFHNLPNGNFSKRFTRGYVTGFDHTMLGTIVHGRQAMAQQLAHCDSVLDIGCAGGKTAAELQRVGIKDVWGLDPSPYLLQHAARDYPGIHFIQGVAEATDFTAGRFAGMSACFVFHELPPRYVELALKEANRILQPQGLLAICEPSPIQLELSPLALLRHYGVKGLYFGLLARLVHEPFVSAWHRNSNARLFQHCGFELLQDQPAVPLRHMLLRKTGPAQEERLL